MAWDNDKYGELLMSKQYEQLLEYSKREFRESTIWNVDWTQIDLLAKAYALNGMYAGAIETYCASLQKFVYDIEETLMQYNPDYPPIYALSTVEDVPPMAYLVMNNTKKNVNDFPLPFSIGSVKLENGESKEAIEVFKDFEPQLQKKAYEWVRAKKVNTFAYMSLFYMYTQYEFTYFPIARRVMRHLGMNMYIQRNAGAPPELVSAKNNYIENNCTFQGEQNQDVLIRLVDEAWLYFSPVGRDNYIKNVERFSL